MCFNTVQFYRNTLHYAKLRGASAEELTRLEKLLRKAEDLKRTQNYYHANGFDHPKMMVIEKNDDGFESRMRHWGLIPGWIKNKEDALEIWNKTVNARGESMFEKPSFRDAAEHSRCVVPLAAYFEHHHKNKKTFPFLIEEKHQSLLFIAGITSSWTVPTSGEIIETFTFITTPPNAFVSQIHNNPKKEEARMPMILESKDIFTWFDGNQDEVRSLVKPNTEIELVAHPVKKLSGSNYIGNVPEILDEHYYPELDEQISLFD